MRKLAEIQNDLATAIGVARGVDQGSDQYRSAIDKVTELTNELRDVQTITAAERAAVQDEELQRVQRSAGREFSFVRFMRGAAKKNIDGLEAEVIQEGAKEARELGLSTQGYVIPESVLRAATGQNVGTDADGGYLKETGGIRYLDALKNKIVLTKLGANFLTGLVGDVPFVTGANVTSSWLAEAASVTASKIAYSKATMTPKRNAVSGAVTSDLLRQTSMDVEMMVRNALIDAQAAGIESAAINGSGSSNQPTGLLNASGIGSVAVGTNGGAITWANILKLEGKIDIANALVGRLGYLTNGKVLCDMKGTEKSANTARFLLEEGSKTLNGYPIEWTNFVPSNLTKGTSSTNCSAMVFGDFSQLYIGQWGGIDLVVDPYTRASEAEVKFILNAYNDVLVARPSSFAAIKDITTGL